MNEQCKDCIHRNVCAYKEHYEVVVEHYEKVKEEYSKYPWFKCSVTCTQYRQEIPNPRQILNERGSKE